jgi:hypothetical protein
VPVPALSVVPGPAPNAGPKGPSDPARDPRRGGRL